MAAEFSEQAYQDALETIRRHHEESSVAKSMDDGDFRSADTNHIALTAECIDVEVEKGKVCVKAPVVGKICIPIPGDINAGTVARACLSVCTTWGIPTGVKVSIYVAGIKVASKSFGKC